MCDAHSLPTSTFRHRERRLESQKRYYHERVKPLLDAERLRRKAKEAVAADQTRYLKEDMRREEESEGDEEEDDSFQEQSQERSKDDFTVFREADQAQEDTDVWTKKWGGMSTWRTRRIEAVAAGKFSQQADEIRAHIELGRSLKHRCESLFAGDIPIPDEPHLLYDLVCQVFDIYGVLCRGLTILHGRI
jgi:hypothetical protein